jgi:hypothetical protein
MDIHFSCVKGLISVYSLCTWVAFFLFNEILTYQKKKKKKKNEGSYICESENSLVFLVSCTN